MSRKQIEARSRFWRHAAKFYLLQIDALNIDYIIPITMYLQCKVLFHKYWDQL